jgi:hypothetical protein
MAAISKKSDRKVGVQTVVPSPAILAEFLTKNGSIVTSSMHSSEMWNSQLRSRPIVVMYSPSMQTRFVFLAAVVLFLCGVSLVRAADPAEFSVANFKFERPSDWAWIVPSSSMRKAQLAPPGVDGGAAPEVTFFYFGKDQGGSVGANIQRWVSQFEGGAEATSAMQRVEQYGATKATFVTAAGTFNSGMPGGPTTPLSGYALLGAILEGVEGNVFIKMTGPDAAVRAASPAFEALVEKAAKSPQ